MATENRQKFQGNNNLWDSLNRMELDAENLTSELFNYFSGDELQGLVEHLEGEGY